MEEVLTRRFLRAKGGSDGFSVLPDLILMDGGRGQVHVAEKVLRTLDVHVRSPVWSRMTSTERGGSGTMTMKSRLTRGRKASS
jgi:excinuclease UvrABC nuclease subunit